MSTYGKRMSALRKKRKMTQDELARLLNTSISVIGRYEMDEMTPSIELARKNAGFLDTTMGYLPGEICKADLFKDRAMHQRLVELVNMDNTEKSHILHVLDGFIKSVNPKNIASL